MKPRQIVGALALVAALAAVVAGPASATLPRFTQSNGVPPESPVAFKGTISNGVTFYYEGGGSVAYEKGTISGEITGATSLANITLTFTKPSELKNACDNTETGVVLSGLKGRLGYINKSTKKLGVMFEPTNKGVMAKCEIPIVGHREYRGDFILELKPVNELTKTFTLFGESIPGTGIQKPAVFFEGESEKYPEIFPLTLGKWNCKVIAGLEYCEPQSGSLRRAAIGINTQIETAKELRAEG
jgi:hypothetical protein